ncbi:ribosome-associated protein [Nitrosospira sp. Nl5]|uniref:ribosome biogenesis factor YjgA n=1 Tax=Nitrosospira sp. Nl5 TaxID=200120 RepID=UPI00088747DB|nr:ribosome biogenesis factor YjgA [Nitrosospira sp. Nl5]SCY20529.1 ribosome-associated protein [Nitrosospira sp. Nl5]
MIAVSHCRIKQANVQKKPPNHSEEELQPSKTRLKREMHALQDIGEQLVQLDPKRLVELGLPETLTDAILEAKRMTKHGARRRQMQFIGKLMRDVDAAPILEKFDLWSGATLQHTAWLHLLERWRSRLLTDEQAFAELGQKYPAADLQHLRTLARNAHKEKLANKPPRSFRALFHELQTVIPEGPEPGGSVDK